MNTPEQRLQILEEICAHQAAEIDSLSKTVQEQWGQIDGLKKSLLQFRERLNDVEDTGGGGFENTKPPHY